MSYYIVSVEEIAYGQYSGVLDISNVALLHQLFNEEQLNYDFLVGKELRPFKTTCSETKTVDSRALEKIVNSGTATVRGREREVPNELSKRYFRPAIVLAVAALIERRILHGSTQWEYEIDAPRIE